MAMDQKEKLEDEYKKRIPHFFIIAGIIIIAIIIGGIWYYHARNTTKSNAEKISIRLKWLHQAQFAGFYYADKGELYKNKGLNVTLNPGGSDFPAIQMVASGSEQFGVTGADQILLAREKGIPVVALAVIYRKTPFVLFSLKDSGIKNLQQFKGKKIGIKLGGNEELTYRAMVKAAGLNSKDWEEVPVKYDISPLLTKQVDVYPGYAINEPIAAEEQGYKVNIISPADYKVNIYADTLFTTEKMIQEKPDVVRNVVQATLEGWQKAIDNPSQAVTYTLQYGDNLNRKHETQMLNVSIPYIKPDNKAIGYMDKSSWSTLQDLLLKQNFMKKSVNLNKAFTTQFIK